MLKALRILALLFLPALVFAQVPKTDSQLTSELQNLIPNNTQKLITPANVRTVVQDGWDSRVSMFGEAQILGKLTYNSLFPITNDGDLIYKAYLDDRLAGLDSTGGGGAGVTSFEGRIGPVFLDSLDLVGLAYPRYSNPEGYLKTISSATVRAMFSQGTGITYNSSTGQISFSGTTTNVPEGSNLYFTAARVKALISGTNPINFNPTTGVITLTGLSTLGAAGQQIRINSGGTGFEYFTPTTLTTSQALVLNGPDVTGSGTIGGGISTTITNNAITTLKINNGAVTIPKMSATGTPDATKFHRGNDTWSQINYSDLVGAPSGGTQIQSDYTQSNSAALDFIKNKPTLSTVAGTGAYSDLTGKPTIPAQLNAIPGTNVTITGTYPNLTFNSTGSGGTQLPSDWTATSGVTRILNKPTFATVATSGAYADLSGKPTIPAAQVNSDWNSVSGLSLILNKPTIPAAQVPGDWTATSGPTRILNKPTLSTVATTGSYSDLTGKPTIPSGQVNSDWAASSGVAAILNKPTIPAAQVSSDWNAVSGVAQILNKPTFSIYELIANKSTTLVSPSNTTYPTTLATANGLATKQDQISLPATTLMGNPSGSTATYSPITIGSGLVLSSGSLSATPTSTTPLVVNTPLIIGSGTGTCVLVDSDGNTLVDTDGTPLVGPCGSGLSIQKADSTKDGYLSKEDWLYFYHKANAGAGGAITTETDPFYTAYGAQKATTLTINGVTQDLSTNRSWTIAGGVTSFNSRTGVITPLVGDYSGFYYPISSNPSNYLTTTTGDARYPLLTGSYANPTFVASLPSSKITGLGAGANWNTYNDIPGRPSAPPAQIQADYTQTNTTALDYIKNKPTLPTGLTTGDKGDISVNNIVTDWSIDPNTITSSKIVDGEVKGAELEDVTTAGTYNGGTYDVNGRLITGTNTAYITGNQTITYTNDVTGSGTTNVSLTLKNTGTSGNYNNFNTDTKGRVISGTLKPYLTRDSIEFGTARVQSPLYVSTLANIQVDLNGNIQTDIDGNPLTDIVGTQIIGVNLVSASDTGVVTPAQKAYWDSKANSVTFPGSNGDLFFKGSGAIASDPGLNLNTASTNRVLILSQNSNTAFGYSEYRAASDISDFRMGTGGSGTQPFYSGTGTLSPYSTAGASYLGTVTNTSVILGTNFLVRQVITGAGDIIYPAFAGSGDRYTGVDANGKAKIMPDPTGGGGSGDGGILTFSSVGSSPNANGATVSGTVATLQPFDATHPGVGRAVDYVRLYHSSYTLKKFQSASQINTGTLTNLYLYSIPANTFSVNNDGLSGNFNFAVIKNGGDPFPPAVALMYNTDTLCKLNAADFPTGTSFAEIEFYAVSYSTAPVFNVKVTIHTGNGFSGGSATTKHYSNVAYSANYSTAQNFRLLGKGSYVSGNSGRIIFEPGD
jgi:hypothetical protein